MDFAEGEVIGGDVLVVTRESFFTNGELVHESEAEVVFFGGKVDFEETARELAGGFPTNLATEARLVASALD